MSKFEALIPITPVQKALLVHKQVSEKDEGELHVRLTLRGKLDLEKWNSSWDEIVKTHPTLRTTVHWEKVKSPIQVVHHHKAFPLVVMEHATEEQIEQDIKSDLDGGYQLSQAYAHPLRLYQLETELYELVWFCHHMLLDGWSTTLVINDWMQLYSGQSLEFRPTMQQFIKWKKKNVPEISQLDWSSFSSVPPLLTSELDAQERSLEIRLDQKNTVQIQAFCKSHGFTLNTFFLSAWMACLHAMASAETVVTFSTVSGRNIFFPGAQELVGLLSNIVPVFSHKKEEENITTWMSNIQAHAAQQSTLSHYGIHELQLSAQEKDIYFHSDALYTFENFPSTNIKLEELEVSNYTSGLTSNLPLSFSVLPGEETLVHFSTHSRAIATPKLQEIVDLFEEKWKAIIDNDEERLWAQTDVDFLEFKSTSTYFVPPKSATEWKIAHIWQDVLGIDRVSTQAHFFQLGGKSIQAIQIFNRMEKELGKNISPAKLVEHPTIQALSSLVDEDSEEQWSNLVPLNNQKKGHPFFCIHAGGAHVFVYRELAEALEASRPVFGIQPSGLDGSNSEDETIEEMSAKYLKEIRKIQPTGPVNMLGYCFSAAIVAEIMNQLGPDGEQHHAVIVDSAPSLTYGRQAKTLKGKIIKVYRIFRDGQWERLSEMFYSKWKSLRLRLFGRFESPQMKQLREVENQLSQSYKKYEWKKGTYPVHLIRSQEFAGRSDKDVHVEWWQYLVNDQLMTYTIAGKHRTLFQEGNVATLAEQIDTILKRDE